jgi:2-polyprenyl-3-methyl-5-hydroxy-6-metoxy-1,4-benzoquinol methylase
METIIEHCPLCDSKKQHCLYDDYENNSYVRCEDCNMTFQNPRKKTEYEINYWGERTDPDGKKRVLVNERKQSIKNKYYIDVEYINKMPAGEILDAGAGFGHFLSAINSDWRKSAIELSGFCVDHIKSNYPDVFVRSEMLEDASFEDESFDVIYCHHVIEHVEDPHSVMKNLSRMLKKGGLMVLGAPNIDSFASKRFKGNYRLLGSPHILMWNKQTLSKLMGKYDITVFRDVYPYFRTDYVTFENIFRLFNKTKMSPPFYGNLMTLYARKEFQ